MSLNKQKTTESFVKKLNFSDANAQKIRASKFGFTLSKVSGASRSVRFTTPLRM